MTEATTQMRAAIDEVPEAVARLLAAPAEAEAAGALLRAADPAALATVARGSSDHAALYLKYAVETTLGIPVASVGPSVASIYGRRIGGPRVAALMISQSGQSADLLALARSLAAAGSPRVTLTNTAGSPLALAADRAVDVRAGPEPAVAATKSFVASVVAGLMVLSAWARDAALAEALTALPEALEAARRLDWSAAIAPLMAGGHAMVLGRGPMLGIAAEVALKCLECCALPVAAYSTAEVQHGPAAVLTGGFPVLVLAAAGDAAEAGDRAVVARLAAQGARVIAPVAGGALLLPGCAAAAHPLLTPLLSVMPAYAMVEAMARRSGLDPDRPPHLSKVTITV